MAIRASTQPSDGAKDHQDQFGTKNVSEECLVLTAGGPINHEEKISVDTESFIETRISTKEWNTQIEVIQSVQNILVAALPAFARWDCRSGVVLSTQQTRPAMRLTVWSVDPALEAAVNHLYKIALPLLLKNFHYVPERTSDLALKERVENAAAGALRHIKAGNIQGLTLTQPSGESVVIQGTLQRPPEYRGESEKEIIGIIDGFRRSQRVFWIMASNGRFAEIQYDPGRFGKLVEEWSKGGQPTVKAKTRLTQLERERSLTLLSLEEAPGDLFSAAPGPDGVRVSSADCITPT